MDEEGTGFCSESARCYSKGQGNDNPKMLQNAWSPPKPREWSIHIHMTSGEVTFQDLTYDEAEAMLEVINSALANAKPFCKLSALTFSLKFFSHAHLKKMPGEPKKRSWLW